MELPRCDEQLRLNEQKSGLVADRTPLFAEALGAVLTRVGLRVTPIDSETELLRSLDPRVCIVICDAGLGLHAAAIDLARGRGLTLRVAVVADGRADAHSLLKLGVAGVLDRHLAREAWPIAVRDVIAGHIVVSPRFQAAAFEDGRRSPGLTARELRVLSLAATGLSRTEIGAAMCVSAGTIKVHLHRAYQKLGVTSCMAAVVTAHRLGLISLLPNEQVAVG